MKNLLSFFLYFCFFSKVSAQGIEAFGDSQTAGLGASDAQHTWVYLLSKKLGTNYTNHGVSGSTVYRQGVVNKNFIDKVPFHNNSADYVTIMFGTNSDGNNFTREWIQEYKDLIINNIINKGYSRSKIYLMAPVWNGIFGDGFVVCHDVVQQIASDLGINFIDLYNFSKTYIRLHGINSFFNPDDLLHFNDEGHAAVAEFVANSIGFTPLPIQPNTYQLVRVKGSANEFEGSFIASETTDTKEFNIMMGNDGIHFFKVHVIIPQKIIENQLVTFKFKIQ